jgi:hypothetical protein
MVMSMLTPSLSETPETPSEAETPESPSEWSSGSVSIAASGNNAAQMADLDAVIDDSLIPLFSSSSFTEDDEGAEDDDDEDGAGEAGQSSTLQPISAAKKKNKSMATAARGPTALPRNRGNGFEGTASQSLTRQKRLMLNDNRVLCGSAHDSRRSTGGETRDLSSVRVLPRGYWNVDDMSS